MRSRSETLSSLGRAPARQSKDRIPLPSPAPLPPTPPAPERGSVRRWLHGALFDNLGLKFLSMVLAVTVFLLVNDDKDREINVRVGVSYVLPEDKVLVSDRVDEVRVTLRGPWRRLRKFDEGDLPRISVDLRGAQTGDIAFSPDLVQAPPGLSVASITPRTMRVLFDKRIEKTVEVSATLTGHPRHGYRVAQITTTPKTVKVRGAEKLLGAMSSVRTREVSLDNQADTFASQVALLPPEGISLVGPELVSVEVALARELVTKAMPEMIVAVRGDGVDVTKWQVTPRKVEVTLTGALLAIEGAKDAIVPTVRVSATDRMPREAEVTVQGVPPGIGVRISPERVKVTPIK